MKRWHTKLAVFVLLGVVVNIAVAWGIAWRHEFRSVTGDGQVSIGYSSASDPRWFVGMVTKPGTTYLGFGTGSHVRADPDKFEVIADDLPDWSLASQPPVRRGTSGTSEPIGFTEVAYGWPAVTLFYRMGGIDPTGFTGIPPIYGGLRLPERSLPKDLDVYGREGATECDHDADRHDQGDDEPPTPKAGQGLTRTPHHERPLMGARPRAWRATRQPLP